MEDNEKTEMKTLPMEMRVTLDQLHTEVAFIKAWFLLPSSERKISNCPFFEIGVVIAVLETLLLKVERGLVPKKSKEKKCKIVKTKSAAVRNAFGAKEF